MGQRRMFGMKGRWETYKSGIRYNTISTSPGQGGSLIFINKNGGYFIIGIHIYGTNKFNSGPLLDGTGIESR